MRKFGITIAALLIIPVLAGCGGTVSVPLPSVAFNETGGYVIVPREHRAAKKTAAGADAYFCEKGTCRSIPVGDLTKSDEEKKKEKKKGKSFPLQPRYLGASGGYVLIPREEQKTRVSVLFGVVTASTRDAGAAGADVYFCKNFACNKVPVR